MTEYPLDADLVRTVLAAPLSSNAQVAHVNESHVLPWGGSEVVEFPDGCRFTPAYEGCWLYSDERKGDT